MPFPETISSQTSSSSSPFAPSRRKVLREKFFLGLGVIVPLACVLGMIFGSASHGQSLETGQSVGQAASPTLLSNLLKYGFTTAIFAMMLKPLLSGKMKPYYRYYRLLRPRMIVESVFVIAAVILVAEGLVTLFPFLDRSWLYLIPANGGKSANIAIMPATIKYVGVLFLIIFGLCLPRFAHREELDFRRGTKDWKDGTIRSLKFGLVHCVMGIPLFVGLALTVGGLWFTYHYFKGGIERSTTYHLAYNFTILIILAISLSLTRVLF